MRFISIIVLIGVFTLFNSVADAQQPDERDYRKWITKKPVIKSIEVEVIPMEADGQPYFDSSEITGALFSKKSWWWLALKKDRRRRIQRETLTRDTLALKYLYLSKGFLNAQITEEFEQIEPQTESDAKVKITIMEGRQFFYGDVSLEGNYPLEHQSDFDKIVNRFSENKPVDPFKLRQAAYDIKSILANNGYPYAKADYFINTPANNNLADITFLVEADSMVHFGDIEIRGADKFDNALAERELTFKKGDLYKRKDIINSQKRLNETGYYITTRLESQITDTSTILERLNPGFVLHLRERDTRYVNLRTGAAQDSIKDLIWSAGASWGKKNFLRSRHLELAANSAFVIFTEWRLKEHSYRIRITEPWFLGIRMPLSLTAQFEPGVKSLVQPYRKQTWSISVNTIKAIGEKLRILTGLQYEQVNIYDIDPEIYGDDPEAEDQIKREEGISIRRKLYLNVIRDSRNSFFIPTKGSKTSVLIEYIGGFLGGGESFYKIESSWSRYQKLWPGWISATRIKGGVVQEIGDQLEVPVDDRFYIGGASTIRGFREKELGPATGSDIIIIFNQELRFPIIGKFWGSIFSDVGNGYRYRADIKFNNLAVSYGAGIQFMSPAGPIRLDYARQVKVKGIEPVKNYRFHFTILYAF